MRMRLLPILMFALVGMVTVKVDAVWNAVEVSVGSESLAQAEAPAESQPAPTEQPTAPSPGATPTGEQASATEQPTPAEAAAPSEPTAQQATTTPAAAEEHGTGEPTPEEAAAAEAAKEALVPDPFDYTDEEVDVLQQLAKRREELDVRARQLDEREVLLQAAEQRMEQKMAELTALQTTVEELLKQRSEQEEAELMSLVKMYENMKPKAASKVFEEMDMDVLLDVVGRMNERKVAPILALVTPTRAKEITFELAQRRQLPMPE
jgi:flagellar motility protein MotE (MotC chaperone)